MNKILIFCLVVFAACTTAPETKEIKVGMTRSQVERKLGRTSSVMNWNFPFEINGKKSSKLLSAHWYSKDTVIFIDPKTDTVAIVEYHYNQENPPKYKPGK